MSMEAKSKQVEGDPKQAMYDTTALAARKAIMGDKEDDSRFRMVVQRLTSGKDNLAENIGGIAGAVMGNVDGAVRKKEREIPKDIIAAATDELVDTLIEVAEAADLTDGKDPALKQESLKQALSTLGKAQLERMTPDEKERVKAEFQKAQQSKQPAPSGILGSRRA